jgi:hypothetical protein
MAKEHTLIFQAIRALGVDVPVMQASVIQEADGRQPKVVLTLYGGQTLTWQPAHQPENGHRASKTTTQAASRNPTGKRGRPPKPKPMTNSSQG